MTDVSLYAPQALRDHLRPNEGAERFLKLTKRQAIILNQLAIGLSNKEIARRLQLSPSTVKTHILAIYQKTRLHSRVELALHWVMFTGLLVKPALATRIDEPDDLHC